MSPRDLPRDPLEAGSPPHRAWSPRYSPWPRVWYTVTAISAALAIVAGSPGPRAHSALCMVSRSQSLPEGLCPPRQPCEHPCHPALRGALGLRGRYHALAPPHSLRWRRSPGSLPCLSTHGQLTPHPPEQGGTTLPALCPWLLQQLSPVGWVWEQSLLGLPYLLCVGVASPSP